MYQGEKVYPGEKVYSGEKESVPRRERKRGEISCDVNGHVYMRGGVELR